MRCVYCQADDLKCIYPGVFHPYLSDYGPFDFYQCRHCGSGTTYPMPNAKALASFYANLSGGMAPQIRELRDRYPLEKWFRQCMTRGLQPLLASGRLEQPFQWLDLGAGQGELARILSEQFPDSRGLATDFHELPSTLQETRQLQWRRMDLSQTDFSLDPAFLNMDAVFSITVLEHLPAPDLFIERCLKCLAPGGVLYLTLPRIDCWAFRLLGKRWPYFLPGEHLTIPSIAGMHALLQRLGQEAFGSGKFQVSVQQVVMPYPARYYAGFFRLSWLNALIPAQMHLGIPTGLLELVVRRL